MFAADVESDINDWDPSRDSPSARDSRGNVNQETQLRRLTTANAARHIISSWDDEGIAEWRIVLQVLTEDMWRYILQPRLPPSTTSGPHPHLTLAD